MTLCSLEDIKKYLGISYNRIEGLCFIGSGLNDMVLTPLHLETEPLNFKIVICSTGNQFKWSDNGGLTYSSPINLSTTDIQIKDNLKVRWGSLAGHTDNDFWTFRLYGDDYRHDEKLTPLISQVSQMIMTYCNRYFEDKNWIEYHDGGYNNKVFPIHTPIKQVSSIEENETSLAATDYKVYDTYIVKKDANWSLGYQNIKISYTSGDSLPDDIKYCAIDLVSILSRLKTTTYTTNEGIEASIVYTSIPSYLKEILNRYKIWGV